MKVAFCNRPSFDNPLGGDAVQMLKTKEYLEKQYNLQIEIITRSDDLNKSFDLIHVFNFVTCEITREFIQKANALKIPVVSSSIFWDYSYATDKITNFFISTHISKGRAKVIRFVSHALARLFGKPYYLSHRMKQELRNFIYCSDYILPNSIEEAELLFKFVDLDIQDYLKKISVVYNATEIAKNMVFLNENEFLSKYKLPPNYILQVGRIEPVKNQINLIFSLMKEKEIPIVLLGKEVNYRYSKKLKRLAEKRGNVYFIREVDHKEVFNFYRYASLHVLLSLRESPGLVSLEALSNNCPIVISNDKYTPIRTYFKDQPYVVDPFDIKKINETIKQAYRERKIGDFAIDKYSWSTTADQTYDIYQKILNK